MMQSYFEKRRAFAPHVGDVATLYGTKEQCALVDGDLRHLLNDNEVIRCINNDKYPIPSTEDREGYHDNRHLSYWLSGYKDVVTMEQLGVTNASFSRVLDLGGASGRVSRHILNKYAQTEIDILELNINHVEWIEQHFGKSIRAVKIGPYPHFPYPDETFSFCCAFSLFTHVDAYETTLLAEISRVLKNGSLVFLTIHSEHTWDLLPDVYVHNSLKSHNEFSKIFKKGQKMPFDHKVFEYNPGSIEYNCNTFISSDYVKQRWSKWFEIISITPNAHGYQTGVLMKKR